MSERRHPHADGLVPWSAMSDAEKELLQRVESQVLVAHDRGVQGERPEAAGRGLWAWAGSWALACAVACVAWWLWPAELPSLRAEGNLKLEQSRGRVQTTLQRHARLKDPQGWRLRSHNQSQLKILRSPKQARVELHSGAVSFYVKPGAMKRFVVVDGELQVVVKGTRFLVWKGRSGTRVEVTRGHVMVRSGSRRLVHLYKGQGVRVGKGLRLYKVPKAGSSWLEKVESLAKHTPSELYAYAADLVGSRLVSAPQRAQTLETAAHALEGARRWAQASRLWLRLYRQKKRGFAAQTALYHAAQSCRHSRAKRSRCLGLYRAFLRTFPKALSPLQQGALYWSALLHHEAHPRKAQAQLRQYLRRFPRGHFARRARSWLQKSP